MRLTETEYEKYLEVQSALMHYIGGKEKMLVGDMSVEDLLYSPVEIKLPIRDKIFEKIGYVTKFIAENPYHLTAEQLEIASGYKSFQKGQYWVVKYTKDYALFIDDNYAYGVLALSDLFEWILGENLPVMVEAILLPFKGRIIYDGILRGYNVSFGRGISSSVKQNFNEAKAKYGIITSLPIDRAIKEKKFTDEDNLRLYMKTASSRKQYWYEIEELLDRNPKLENLHAQLWGQINSRSKRKSLKGLGIKNHYFAISHDVILASATTKAGIEKQMEQLLSKELQNAVYIFKV